MGKLLRTIHTTAVPSGTLPSVREKVLGWIDYMEEHYLKEEDAGLLRNVLAAIPERNTILHCDFHEGNVMVQDGELILIDLDDICTGHPIFDLVFNYMGHVIAAQSMPQVIEKSMQLSPENALKIRKYMLKTYFGTEDQDTLEKYDQVIGAFSTFVMLVIPGKSKDSRNINPETAKAIVDTILPKFRQVAPMLPQMIGILD